jgi:hypothetical protein
MRPTLLRHGAALFGIALAAGPAAAFAQETSAKGHDGVIVHDGKGGIGFFSGGASGFIGGTGPNGFEGVYVGPDGKARRMKSPPGAPAVVAPGSGVTFFDPTGFDPFAFAFGPSRSPFGPSQGLPPNPAPAPSPNPVPFGPDGMAPRPALFDLDPARRAFRRGDVRATLRLANAAARTCPDDVEVDQVRALALFALGRFDEAGRAIRPVLDAGAAWDDALLNRFYDAPDAHERQYQALRRAAQAATSADVHLLMAYHARALGHDDDRRAAVQKALQIRPDDPLIRDLWDDLNPPEAQPDRP